MGKNEKEKKGGRLTHKKFQDLIEQLKDKMPEKELMKMLEKDDLIDAATRKNTGSRLGGGVKMGIYVSDGNSQHLNDMVEYYKTTGENLSKNELIRRGIEHEYSLIADKINKTSKEGKDKKKKKKKKSVDVNVSV